MKNSDDAAYWLALQRAPGVGPARFGALLSQFGSPRALFEDGGRHLLGSKILTQDTLRYLHAPDWEAVEQDLLWLDGPNKHIVTLDHPNYPPLLKEIHDPPPLLFVHGKVELLAMPQLAMVGGRHPSPEGKETAYEFACCLSQAGLAITSGLALGIDGACHRGALSGGGHTVAVLGNGLERVYPAQHHDLAHQISETGALVSEFSPRTPALAEHFPRRNRIISGLSLGTLVVEATTQSGSLITTRFSLEQGREVFAIPGSIHNPMARGCHALIRQGAKLVETVDDVLEELRWMRGSLGAPAQPALEAQPTDISMEINERKVFDCMGYEAVAVDTLVQRSGLTPEEVSSILLVLELHGHISSLSGGRYSRLNTRQKEEGRYV